MVEYCRIMEKRNEPALLIPAKSLDDLIQKEGYMIEKGLYKQLRELPSVLIATAEEAVRELKEEIAYATRDSDSDTRE